MNPIQITLYSHLPHNAQILTGFRMLQQQGWEIHTTDFSTDPGNPFPGAAFVRAEYRGKTIFYDLWDGYQRVDTMRLAMDQADYYFKRSFSREKNAALFPGHCHKIHPLGFNYHVTCAGTAFAEPLWKAAAKVVLGRVPERYFTPDRFEGIPNPHRGSEKILFLTRLWDPWESGLSESEQLEREQLNHTRIAILRTLSQHFGSRFTGGLNDSPLSREYAPDLIVSHRLTDRKQYLQLLHSSDICIASTGLHGSIGWKTGEYVAAAKAIVSEPLYYEVPGEFREGTHFRSFRTPEGCLDALQSLLDTPDRLFAMQQANEAYYHRYLRPDVLVKNTLAIVSRQADL